MERLRAGEQRVAGLNSKGFRKYAACAFYVVAKGLSTVGFTGLSRVLDRRRPGPAGPVHLKNSNPILASTAARKTYSGDTVSHICTAMHSYW